MTEAIMAFLAAVLLPWCLCAGFYLWSKTAQPKWFGTTMRMTSIAYAVAAPLAFVIAAIGISFCSGSILYGYTGCEPYQKHLATFGTIAVLGVTVSGLFVSGFFALGGIITARYSR